MSTKTTFKRIALVAVAALGLGVMSVAPSQAVPLGLTVGSTDGTAITNVGGYDTTTGAIFEVSYLAQTATSDSVTVTAALATAPVGAYTTRISKITFLETRTSLGTTAGDATVKTGAVGSLTAASKTVTWITAETSTGFTLQAATGNTYVGGKFLLNLDTTTAAAPTTATLSAGTYTYTIVVTPYSATAGAGTPILKNVSVVVSAAANASKTANAANSTAVLTAGDTGANTTVDSAVAALSTASSTAAAVIRVKLKNTAGGNANESITATVTGPGVIGDGTTFGKSVVLAHTAGDYDLQIRPDGSAGVATINVSSTSVTFAPKTVTFYAKSPKTITAATYNPVLNIGSNLTAVAATAVDANGINWAGALYIVASSATDALVGGSATAPVACTYDPTEKTHFCPVTTIAAGTAKFKVVDQSLALGTETAYAAAMTAATSNEVTVKASSGVPTTVKLAFDKATYAPFEKALITVTPLDASGNTLGTKTITNLFASGGITANVAFGSSSDTLTAVTLSTEAADGTDKTAGSKTYVVYMPAQGDVTISATGGTGLAAAGQVKVTATASVVNSSVDAATDAANEATDAANAATDAALAAADAADAATAAAQDASDAVAALSASVSKMISNLRAQITSLTNLVIKIQKKVKA